LPPIETACHTSHSSAQYTDDTPGLGPGYTRDWLPSYRFVSRARAMVLTGECTLSDMSEQDNIVLELGRQPPITVCTDCRAP
jgi:hypothetical protein